MKKRLVIFSAVSCTGDNCYDPQGPWEWGSMMQMHYGYGGIFMWIIFLIVMGLLIYFIVQATKTKGLMPAQSESALDILKKRYAKGEINKEDFDRMKTDLES